MKKLLVISAVLSLLFIFPVFSYQLNQQDMMIINTLNNILYRSLMLKGESYRERYVILLQSYQQKYLQDQRKVAILQQVIGHISINSDAIIASAPLTDEKSVILQLTTLNENAPQKRFQYNYAEDIGDGRGVTFGIIGFTTGTFDGNILLKNYTRLNPNNTLKKYISVLDKIDRGYHDDEGLSNDQTGLGGFIKDINENTDPLFKKAQLDLLESMYWQPAFKNFKASGSRYPLTLAFVYDMTVNHGEDGALSIMRNATNSVGGAPKDGIDEKKWLSKVMDYRYEYLKESYPDGLDRVNSYRKLLDAGNLQLKPIFKYSVYGGTYDVDGNVY